MKIFKQTTPPDNNWIEVGDIWIDPNRTPADGMPGLFMCTEMVVGPTGERSPTYLRFYPQVANQPPSNTTGLTLRFSGTTPERTIELVATDIDGSQHTVAEIVY